jgi:hypothetical protein
MEHNVTDADVIGHVTTTDLNTPTAALHSNSAGRSLAVQLWRTLDSYKR